MQENKEGGKQHIFVQQTFSEDAERQHEERVSSTNAYSWNLILHNAQK